MSRSPTRTQLDAGHVGSRRGHDRAREAEALRLGEPAADLRDLAHLAAEAELADDDRVGRDRRVVARAGDRQRDREVGARLATRARRRRRSRTRRGRRARRRRAAAAIATSIASRPPSNDCATRRGIGAGVSRDERLHLDAQRTRAFEHGRDDRSGRARAGGRRGTARSGSATETRPSPVISMRPSSSVGPKRCFSARSMRSAWCRSPSNDSTVSTTCSSVRGPASEPSLVTWPTSNVAMPRSLASRCSRCAPSRTCATDPGPPGASGSWTAWIESIAITSGAHRFDVRARRRAATFRTTTRRSGASVPSRSARSRTCAADSSAHTSRQRGAAGGHRAERLEHQRALAHARLAADAA